MEIELACMSDAEEILLLQKLAYQSEAELYHDFSIPPLTQRLDELHAQFRDHLILKASEQGSIIGSVRAYAKEGTCFVVRLIVHPERQNQGIGTALMREIETYFPEVKRFELFTGSKSEKNIALYEKLGYALFRRKSLNDRIQLVFMEKIIA